MARPKGIEASVVVDGQALTEYEDEDTPDESSEHTSAVTRYIEAVSDAEFSISVTVPKSHKFAKDGLSFRLSLDGIWVKTWLCRKAKIMELREDWHTTIAGSEVKNGKQWCLRPFKFNDIKIVEASMSTAGSGKSNILAHLGTITLNVFDVKVTKKRNGYDVGAIRLGQPSEIAEKELKGRDVTHQATFGESRPSKESIHYMSKPLSKEPFLSFKFNYRSKKALQGLRLIPMTPSPSPSPVPTPVQRPSDSLTPEGVQELDANLHAIDQAEREANIKREPNIKPEANIIPESNIKPEASSKREPTIKREPNTKGEADGKREPIIKLEPTIKSKAIIKLEAYIKPEPKTKPEVNIEPEPNIKSEKIKSELSLKREHDEEYENMIKSSIAKRAKTRPFMQGETIELD